jgi:uncharacterized protein DUF5372
MLSNAPDASGSPQRFRVTHPFHPLHGREWDLVARRHNWSEDRVYFHDDRGRLRTIPAAWTSVDDVASALTKTDPPALTKTDPPPIRDRQLKMSSS